MSYEILNSYSIILYLLFFIMFILSHIIKKDLSYNNDFTSKYAIGKNKIIIIMGFIFFSISQFLLSIWLYHNLFYYCSLFIFITGISVLSVSIFPMDDNEKITYKGNIHLISAIIYYLFITIGIIFINFKIKIVLFNYITATTVCLLLITFIFLVAFSYNSKLIKYNIKGLIQKLFIIISVTWLIIFNILLLKINLSALLKI